MSVTGSLVSGFTRQEVIKLAGCTSSRLAYLEKVGLVVPQRIGPSKRPIVLFTWEQLLEVRAIKDLRKEVSLQTVRKIVDYLNRNGYDDSLRDKLLVVLGNDVFWVNSDWSDFSQNVPPALKVAGKNNIGQYSLFVLPPFSGMVDDIWKTAEENSNVIDMESFKERAKAKPSAA